MKKIFFLSIFIMSAFYIQAQINPAISSWLRNTTNATGYNGLPCNVQSVYYTATDVYVCASDIPAYTIGPWQANPNTPTNQNSISKFTLTPSEKIAKTYTGLGAIGMWKNGVHIYNPKDGQYWNGSSFTQGTTNAGYNRNALYFEGASFDGCKGHPGPNGAYHHHVSPSCLYSEGATNVHSPIIGYAADGFPIYGPFAYTNTNGTGAIKRLISSYVLGTSRTNGPPTATYPMGSMCEDYIYTAGAGDLDQYNGRFSVTPEYPTGIYAYFVTIDASGTPQYPFIVGPQYFGTPTTGVSQSIPAGATLYTGATLPLDIYNLTIKLSNTNTTNIFWKVVSEQGIKNYEIQRSNDGSNFTSIYVASVLGLSNYQYDDKNLSNGKYFYRIKTNSVDNKFSYSSIVSLVVNDSKFLLIHNNPAKDMLTIQENDALENRNLDIIDLSGKIVLHTTMGIGITMKSLDIQTLYSGMYVIRVSNGNSSKTSKLIVTRD